MKKIAVLCFFIIAFSGCDSEHAWDCLKKPGKRLKHQIELDSFGKIHTGKGIKLVIEQGETQQVILESGENLIDDIAVYVEGGTLYAEEKFSCNFARTYEATTIFVTAPNITEIRNGSAFAVESRGTLRYPMLKLLSEDADIQGDIYTNGNFYLTLETENLSIVSNNISNFYVNGSAQYASIGFYSGDGRFEGKNFIVQHLNIYQRSSNRMFVNPQQSIQGEIRGVGDVISYHYPPVVEVKEYYTGRLVFK